MKSSLTVLLVVLTTLAATSIQAQTVSVVERGPHYRVIETVVEETDPARHTLLRTNRITQLATGLHFWDAESGEYRDTLELVEIIDDVAVARHGPHRVIFSGNAALEDAIDVAFDGKRMRSHVVGLIYVNPQTGASAPLASIRNSQATVVPPNEVWYQDAFDGIRADLAYRYTRAGLEQLVVLREAPHPPGVYGLDPDTTSMSLAGLKMCPRCNFGIANSTGARFTPIIRP